MSIHYRQQGSAIIVLGNTYPLRERIKALGGRFNGIDKHWRIPYSEENLTLIAELCQDVGGGSLGNALAGDTALPQPVATASVQTADAMLFPEESEAAAPSRAAAPAPAPRRPGPETGGDSLTIRQLMERLAQAVTLAFPRAVWVTGEVQNLARRASGLFFDLAEARDGTHANATTTARAIIWGGALATIAARRGTDKLAEVLQDGLQIRCLCQVQFYKDRGSVTLVVEDVDPAFTKGALALAREKLLRELRAKGLDQANKRLPLAAFPFRVGLISADGSRAKSDFLDQLAVTGFPGDVLFCATPMQGESVPALVVAALRRLAAAGCDLIVVTRGGGSAADLRWFDAPEIAYAIANCPVPVVAAIGHHDDVCVAEEICHLRQKTPTAAADFVASCFVRAREAIDALAAAMAKTLERRVEEFEVLAATLGQRLANAAQLSLSERGARLLAQANTLHRGATGRLHAADAVVAARGAALTLTAERSLAERRTRLGELETKICAADPKPWLEQGWTRLDGARGRLRRAEAARLGEVYKARLLDGWLELEVTQQHLDTDQGAKANEVGHE